ncbi:hypothetical protein BGZ97_003238, partial [Linnemannia gamsii]
MVPKPVCIWFGSDPSRSMLFPSKTTCKEGEWVTDFAFYETTMAGTSRNVRDPLAEPDDH